MESESPIYYEAKHKVSGFVFVFVLIAFERRTTFKERETPKKLFICFLFKLGAHQDWGLQVKWHFKSSSSQVLPRAHWKLKLEIDTFSI